MKKVNCVFCDALTEKAKEHIWPRWLQIKFYGNTKSMFRGTHSNIIKPEVSEPRIQSGESLVFGKVCKNCNNKWMGDLECSFKVILENIFIDRKKILILTKKERHDIAIWAFKTALMINSGSNYRTIMPEVHYKHLYNYKTLIKNVNVDICILNDINELKWKQSNLEFGISKKEDENNFKNFLNESYRITMQIGFLGIRVTFFPNAKENGYKVFFHDETKTLRIWPYNRKNQFIIKSEYDNINSFDADCYIKII